MNTPQCVEPTSELYKRFAEAKRVFVLTGAGISAESNVPTFRGGGGAAVWKGMPFDVISSAEMIERDLDSVWEWFDYRIDKLGAVYPNPGHEAVAKWQDWFPHFTLVTQNIDGLHQRAGSRDVIELHGSIWRARCVACDERVDLPQNRAEKRPVRCNDCGNPLRPDVVLFGEMLPYGAFEQAMLRAAECDLMFVVGTSALVYPAASLPEIARDAGRYIVEVNPERTPLTDICNVSIRGKAGEVLPKFDIQ